MMTFRILLLGGNGLIGSAIQSILRVKCPSLQVLNLDKSQVDFQAENSVAFLKDIARDYRPTHIIILAAVKRQDGDSLQIFDDNELITKHISSAISTLDTHVTYLSSCAVYGEQNQQSRYNEESSIDPTSMYGKHKVSSERVYSKNIDKSRLLILRPPLIYGSRTKGYNPAGFLSLAQENKPIILWGEGDEMREFIHVNDAASIIIELALQNTIGVVNLVSGFSWSYKSIVQCIGAHLRTFSISRDRTGPTVDHTYDDRKLKSLLGNQHFTSPQEFISLQIKRHVGNE